MPFDVLPNRLTSLPQAPQPSTAQPQIIPYGQIVDNMMKHVDDVVKQFSPETKLDHQRVAVEAQKYGLLAHAFQLGQAGDTEGMSNIMRGLSGKGDPFTENYRAHYGATQAQIDAKSNAPLTPAQEAVRQRQIQSNAARMKAAADAARARQSNGAPPVADVPGTPNPQPESTPSEGIGM